MENFLLGVYIALAMIVLALFGFGIIYLIKFLSAHNIIITAPKEGRAKAIIKWDGALQRVVMNYRNRVFFTNLKERFLSKEGRKKLLKILKQEPEESEEPEEQGRDFEKLITDNFSSFPRFFLALKEIGILNEKEQRLVEGKVREERKTGREKEFLPVVFDPWDVIHIPPEFYEALWAGRSRLHWVGLPFARSVYRYRFFWKSREIGKELKLFPISVAGAIPPLIDDILVQVDVYDEEAIGFETAGRVPVDIPISFRLEIINPRRALFEANKWLEVVEKELLGAFRRFVAFLNFEDLIIERQEFAEATKEELKKSFARETKWLGERQRRIVKDSPETAFASSPMIKIGLSFYDELRLTGLWRTLAEKYGVDIKSVIIFSPKTGGKHADAYEETAAKMWRVTREARAEVHRLETVYGKIKKLGPDGMTLRLLETIEAASQKAGNWVIPFGSLQQLAEGVFGRRQGETEELLLKELKGLTPEELKSLVNLAKQGGEKQ